MRPVPAVKYSGTRKKKKKLDRRQLEEGSNAYTLKFFTIIRRILPFQRLVFFPPAVFFFFFFIFKNVIFYTLPLALYWLGEFTWLTYQLAAWDEKSAIRHSSQCGSEMVPFVRDELQHVGVGVWPSQVLKEEWRLKRIFKERRRESRPANINRRLTHCALRQVKSASPLSSTSHPPPYCCACVSRRIRRQHEGGGAKKGLFLLAPPPPCCKKWCGDSSRFKRTLNKYTIKYSAYIYFIYIFKEQHI